MWLSSKRRNYFTLDFSSTQVTYFKKIKNGKNLENQINIFDNGLLTTLSYIPESLLNLKNNSSYLKLLKYNNIRKQIKFNIKSIENFKLILLFFNFNLKPENEYEK